MRKIIVIPVIALIVIIIGFSFIPMLEQFHRYSFDSANEKRIGEGQKFVDASGKRCLMSETIAGDKCPSSSRGITADGKYDTGISGMAEIYAKEYGLNDPYDPSSMTRFDATMGIQKTTKIHSQEEVEEMDRRWLSQNQKSLRELITNNDCNTIQRVYIMIEYHITNTNEEEYAIKMYNQGLQEYKDAYQEFCE